MSENYRKAKVYIGETLAGIVSESENGFVFLYDSEYLLSDEPIPISLTLPLSEKEYESSVLFPFFDGIIPEGWLYEQALHNWKLNRRDRFGMLLVACKDCIGDVSIKPYE